jgi:hypothetical protein
VKEGGLPVLLERERQLLRERQQEVEHLGRGAEQQAAAADRQRQEHRPG